MDDNIILEMHEIDKVFPGVHALKKVDLTLRKGEVLALVGENGAGKSTLMKVLTGVYTKDGGSIVYENQEVSFSTPREALDAGIVMVHQELQLIGHLTAAQNIYVGKELKKGFLIDDEKMNRESKKLFDILGVDIDPKIQVSKLTVGKQQLCEIAKAISNNAKILVFDEPTAALTDLEIEQLFKIIKDLRSQGYAIVYISHRMDEIEEITDRVAVLRDGQFIGTMKTKDTNKSEIINMMVGRVIFEDPKISSNVPDDAPVVLEVSNLNAGKLVKNINFKLKKGEILGFSGLMGAGRTEVARAIFGADPKESGEIIINGKAVEINSPEDAVAHGIGYLSEDRKRYGLILKKNIIENSTITCLDNFINKIFIDKNSEKKISNEYIEKLNIKTPNAEQLVLNLSGGNQQKVVIGKWLINDSEILIFDEPTRGIDVGAKQEIYELMNQLVSEGKSIIMISSELPEVLRMSDRILVMCEGSITGEINIEEATQEKIMHYATLRIAEVTND